MFVVCVFPAAVRDVNGARKKVVGVDHAKQGKVHEFSQAFGAANKPAGPKV